MPRAERSATVALNADRTEEERNGVIRSLRPDYQTLGEVQTQQVIEGMTEVEAEGRESKILSPLPMGYRVHTSYLI